MPPSNPHTITLFLTVAITLLAGQVSGATQSIASLPAYQSQRSCAIPCFWNGSPGVGTDSLGVILKCNGNGSSSNKQAADDCYCRADLAPVASSWLSTCVGGHCSSNAVDVSSAIGVYEGYCADKRAAVTGVVSATATATATVTGGSGVTTMGGGTAVATGVPPATTVFVTRSMGSRESVSIWVWLSCLSLAIYSY